MFKITWAGTDYLVIDTWFSTPAYNCLSVAADGTTIVLTPYILSGSTWVKNANVDAITPYSQQRKGMITE